MPIPPVLDTLVELAVTQTDEAARRLGQSVRAATDCEQKLALLQQYRDDYSARLQERMTAGLSVEGYRNFQGFLDKLDHALAAQQQVVRAAARRVDQDRQAWQASERKRLSYDTLAVRASRQAQQKESRRDQKETDEQAARLLLYRR
jgi:flagellar FliJ protein